MINTLSFEERMQILTDLHPQFDQVDSFIIDYLDNLVLVGVVVKNKQTGRLFQANYFEDVAAEVDDFKLINSSEAPVFFEVKPKEVTIYEKC